ncbi:MAG: glycosyltransferase [Chloroflexi bacterium CFX7]|nr:glycosyltransferase [Chloroflexi bacterium CFX7]MCK6565831.1 glycosyltransferase [Dehalococcoidia bacterium]MCL4232016.1 glycosyltransferase [Dehalococcoidia bacterium]RIL01749.1 MAG: glycosyl transferase family 2 [bacterium]
MGIEISPMVLTVIAVYFVTSTYLLAAAAITARAPGPNEHSRRLFYVLVVPALNEELVIGNTVRHLLTLKGDNYLVLVIDDGSSDRTGEVVRSFPPGKVRLLSRRAPFARQGKGEALNHAYRMVLTSELPELYGADNIVFSVMDADGQVPGDMLARVAPYFADPHTAAVQVGVRMLNAKVNIFTRWQQYEFVTFNWLFSRARESLGSVSLGGNGQFVRMSALASLREGPWTDCLTEDLDIGLRLMLLGWRNRYCHETQVYQQAVPSARRLVRQRSRWYQGHLTCWKLIPRILVSDWPAHRKADVLNYLLAPGLVLPMGIFSLAVIVLSLVPGVSPLASAGGPTSVSNILTWYVLSMGAAPLFAIALWRAKESSLAASIFWAHLFLLGSYIWLLAGLMAVKRMVTGRAGWIKTARTAIGEMPLAADGSATPAESRYVAWTPTNDVSEQTGTLLGLRAGNFLPRTGADFAADDYVAPAHAGASVPAALLLARSEARLARLDRLVAAGGQRESRPLAEV